MAMLAVPGVMAKATSVAGVTVKVVEPAVPLSWAEMVVVPVDTAEARPEALMVAAEVEDDHVTDPVTF